MYQPSLFVPDTDWTPPTGPLPDLRGSDPVAIDTETKDDGLAREFGPGWVFPGWGHVAGISVARGSWSAYYPLRHPDTECRDPDSLRDWLRDLFASDTPIVFFNAGYDLGWLRTMGVRRPPNILHDAHAMAVMADENRQSYSLDDVAKWRGLGGKDSVLLHDAAAAFGCPKKSLTGQWIHKLPARFVGPYAEADAEQTLAVFQSLAPELQRNKVWDAYRTEMEILPAMLDMRERGIRIDTDRCEQTIERLREMRREGLSKLSADTGFKIDEHTLLSPDGLAPIFEAQGLSFPRTAKTNKASFKSQWLKSHGHWLPATIQRIRNIDQMAEKFLGIYILGYQSVGRIHAEIHQLRDAGEDGSSGTRSYRLSYANPPLQQMPSRDPELAPLIRSVFLPEEGQHWGSLDYSQQEPRLAVHFASACNIAGSEDAVRYYSDNPDADFHQMVAEMADIERKLAKIINLGLMYGMGLKKLAVSLGLDLEIAKELITRYHDKVPWVKALTEFCSNRANDRGQIRLIDGAMCHFDLWEPSWREYDSDDWGGLPLAAAQEKWPGKRLKRFGVHKAMNRLVQGSAARQTKIAIREVVKAGFLPLIQMHDELSFSLDNQDEAKAIGEIMTNVVPLRVPMKVDLGWGANWGEAA